MSTPVPKPFQTVPRVPLRELWQMTRNDAMRIDMRSSLERRHAALGDVSRTPLLRMVNLFGPDANRYVLMDPDRVFSARRPWTMIMGRIFPNGLLLMDGEQHQHHRRIMHAPFKRPALRSFALRMGPKIVAALETWPGTSDHFLAFPAFKALTLDLAASIFLGVEPGTRASGMNRAFEDMVAASMSRLRLPLPGLEFERGRRGRAQMLELLAGMVESKRAGADDDLMSQLCRARTETGEAFADAEIFDHMVFLMMAAHDTTTSALTSITWELARHPDWQERVRAESLAFDAEPTFDTLDRLGALSATMQEVLRLYPPLPVIPRTALAPFEFDGYTIPENTMVVVSPIHTHYMEKWWTDPGRFDPGRFSPERAEHERHSHSYVPFGGGPHMCIGRRFAEAQIRLVVHHLVRRYRWSVPDGYAMPVQQAPISKPRDGLPIRLEALS